MAEINDAELATKLRESVSRLLKVMKREIKHDEQLSLTERSSLSLISRSFRITPSELARTEQVTGQAMSQIINKLLELGLIEKIPSETDKRKVFISETTKGHEFIELKRTKTSEWLTKAIAKKCTEEEKRVLDQASDILARLVG
ncbi:MarR family winged helix-turn-helix transcriptional regulator [Microbacter margulisiae]|uniref:DNA-binding MarR family transcriptional regulator n=1 Tax=Microbacter margulisiae TaxID=1350067 RepID=A0A7W5DQZ6_9PORP|nr:MarR family transcriptional regulator [Microbacter margulisiae]MBB3187484.1 DNA-binding MarR family transcriptional regulator [Microbacter margulisiae]